MSFRQCRAELEELADVAKKLGLGDTILERGAGVSHHCPGILRLHINRQRRRYRWPDHR